MRTSIAASLRYRVEPLEPRLLLAADWAGGFAPSWTPDAEGLTPDGELAESLASLPVPVVPANSASDSPDTLDLEALRGLQANVDVVPELSSGAEPDSADSTRLELVVFDAGVEDYEALLASLNRHGGDGVRYEFQVLEAGVDGVQALADLLDGYDDLDAVHVVSHGSDGGVQLGATRLDASSIDGYAETIRSWSGALADDADLLFYGCDFAGSKDGRALVETLAALTGTDVAASTDATGTALLGGDWDLEYRIGLVEVDSFAPLAQQSWNGLLGTIAVTTTADVLDGDADTSSLGALAITPGSDGLVSLREAIIAANTDIGADTITLSADTYTLGITGKWEESAAQGDLDITDDLTLTGITAGATIIDADEIDRVFDLIGAITVSMSDLTIQNGKIADYGGGINNPSATLDLTSVVIRDNWVSNNGGGIYTDGDLTLNRVTISGNHASSNGGGIHQDSSAIGLLLTNVTLSGNDAGSDGGGLNLNADAALQNVTITANDAASKGGGIKIWAGTVTLHNTIIADNTEASGGPDVHGAVVSDGSNIIQDGTDSSGFMVAEIGVNPLLDPTLKDNGGSILTHALLAGSPAIHNGNTAGAPADDPRGFARDLLPDIGAFEFGATGFTDTGMAIWAEDGSTTPQFSAWDGSSFATEADSANVGLYRTLQAAEAPTRNEIIVIGVNSSSVTSGEMWDGNVWTPLPFNDLATVSASFPQGFDVAYEATSGDAMLAWNTGSGLAYRVWDGTTWSAETAIAMPLAAEPKVIQLVASPSSDEMIMFVTNTSDEDYALVWDGTAWGNSQVMTTTADNGRNQFVAYESLSGDAMVVFGDSSPVLKYRFWDGTSWSSESSLTQPAGVTGLVGWSKVASDPNSDRIALGVYTKSNEVWFGVWDGVSTWDTQLATTSAPTNEVFPNIDVDFESQTGEVLAVYVETSAPANEIRYCTWDGSWSAEVLGPDIGGQGNTILLEAAPNSNGIMLAAQDDNEDLNFVLWDGAAWGTVTELEATSGEAKNEPFAFVWNQSLSNLDTDGDGLWDTEEDANTDLDGDPSTNPGPDTDGDITPNYLDADDDGDGTPTSAENADPNADGDPRDALDSDHDGQADYLDLPTGATDGTVVNEQKISDTVGGLAAPLDPDDLFGRAIAGIGDLDGDGINDIAVGASKDDDGGTDRGAVHILFLNADGTVKAEQKISTVSGGLTAAIDDGDFFARSVTAIGDLDGDGVIDLAVGAERDDDGGTNRGAVHILFLNTDGTVKAEQKISAATGGLTATLDDGDFFGVAVTSLGDLDGDGINDIAVGAPRDDDGGVDAGAVHILFLNSDGTVKIEQKISNTDGGFTGPIDADDRFGIAVAGIGDLDGDGNIDIAVGAQLDDDGGADRGAVHIVFLNADGTVNAEQKISDTAGGLTAILDNDDRFGVSVAGIGDLDSDGIGDIVVAATFDDDGGLDRGALYSLFLNADGTVKAEQKISSTAGGFTGALDNDDRFGASVAGLGDLDGDGAIDIAVGAIGDDDGGADRGAVHVLNLNLTAPPAANDAPTFMLGDGVVTSAIGAGDDTGRSVTLQTDGKVIVAGVSANGGGFDLALARYHPNGSLDVSFGSGGKVTTSIGGIFDGAYGVTVQADGKILVAGESFNGGDFDFALVRYDSDGSLDAGFGTGGKVTTAISADSESGRSIAVQPGGRILVGGYSDNDFALVRYNSNGSLDTGFGSGGKVVTAIGPGGDIGNSVVLQADGRILVTGRAHNGSDNDFAVVRYDSDGSLDTSFGTAGKVVTDIGAGTNDEGYSVTVQADGKILVAGESNNSGNADVALVRYNADGSVDGGFGAGGKVTTAIGSFNDTGRSVVMQSDGKILVGGSSGNGTENEFALVRYDSTGSLDASFGTGGTVTTAIGTVASLGYGVIVDGDGGILLAGSSSNGSDLDFALVRYNTDGTLDSSFDPVTTLDGNPTYVEDGAAVVLDANVDVSDAELDALNGDLGNYAGASLTLVRNGAAAAEDVFAFIDNNGITFSGGNLIKNAQVIASFDITSTPGELLVTFTDASGEIPTSADVDNIARQISYANSSDTPPASAPIDWTFDDGNSGAQGSGGALSVTGSTTVSITATNDAPLLADTTPVLTAINEDDFSSVGDSVAAIVIDGSITDADGSPVESIAITAVDDTNGTWQYSTDNGGSWSNVDDGSLAVGHALLLDGTLTGGATHKLRFVPSADYNGSADFTFRAWDMSAGAAGSYADTTTAGTTTPYSTATDTASIAVIPVNDAPLLADAAAVLTAIYEDDFSSVGDSVAAIVVDGSITDVDGAPVESIVITAVDDTNGTWQYSTDNGGSWSNVDDGSLAVGHALLLDGTLTGGATHKLRFVPSADYNGSADFTFRAWDMSAGAAGSYADTSTSGGSTPYSSATDSASIAVNALNDAPALADTTPVLTAINEDDFSSVGDSVATIVIDGSITDVDGSPVESIAITAVDNANGTWQYSSDNGGSWSNVDDGSLAVGHALLLDGTLTGGATHKLRFVPGADYNGSADFTFRAWDMSAGAAGSYADTSTSGGSTPYSSATDSASIAVNALNDAPALADTTPVLTAINEDDFSSVGDSVATIVIDGSITDVDGSPVESIAITAVDNANGTWQYSSDNGGSWSNVDDGSLAVGHALLLDGTLTGGATHKLRFVPSADYSGSATFSFRAWDMSAGAAGSYADTSTSGGSTPYSSATDSASIAVNALNDAPALADTTPVLTAINEDDFTSAGDSVAAIVIDGSITDVDGAPVESIAITAVDNANGTWQYSSDNGGSWSNVDDGSLAVGHALLLDGTSSGAATQKLRFVPDSSYSGSSSFTFRAWDMSAGAAGSYADTSTSGGSTPYSSATDSASIAVNALNDAPALADTTPVLTAINEDDFTSAGDSVAAIVIDGSITDVDGSPVESIAITAVDNANGTWQYSSDNGGSWSNVDDGSLAVGHALLLDGTSSGAATQKLRFVPDSSYSGSSSFTFRAWDMSAGAAGSYADTSTSGGSTPYSSATDSASIAVNALNDAPALADTTPVLTAINEDDFSSAGDSVAAIVVDGSITDVDGAPVESIAITAVDNANGTWQYSSDNGGSWSNVDDGSLAVGHALLLDGTLTGGATHKLRFVPSADYSGSATFSFRAWDMSAGAAGSYADTSTSGGSTPYSSATDSASIAVNALNDAPALADTTPVLTAINEDDFTSAGDSVAAIVIDGSITDVDGAPVESIAITAVDNANGTWQYSSDNGGSWSNVDDGSLAVGHALLLDGTLTGGATHKLRFVPGADYNGSADFTFCAWDMSAGAAGSYADTSTSGGSTPYSSATDSASITVNALNDAPALADITPVLTAINEDDFSSVGDSVATIVIDGSITDVDGSPVESIAITAVDNANGTWQYSSDNGGSWSNVDDGSLAVGHALLLDGTLTGGATHKLRFVPGADYNGSADFTFCAWDMSAGAAGSYADTSTSGGSTPYSSATDSASIAVNALNDAPALADTTPVLTAINEDDFSSAGDSVAAIVVDGSITDVDGAPVESIAITAVDNANGTWQYSSDNGGSWSNVDDGSLAVGHALLLDGTLTGGATHKLRFVPSADYSGSATFSFRAWDMSAGAAGSYADTSTSGGSTPYSSATDSASIAVNALNDAPVDVVDAAAVADPLEPPPLQSLSALPPTSVGLPALQPAPVAPSPAPGVVPGLAEEIATPLVPLPLPDSESAPAPRPIAIDELVATSVEALAAPVRASGAPAVGDAHRGDSGSVLEIPSLVAPEIKPEQENADEGSRPEFVVTKKGIALGLDRMRNSADEEIRIRRFELGQSAGVAAGLSVGYVSWLLRGGVLLSSVLSSLPAWRFIDPLPVFSSLRDRPEEADDDDDESLEAIVEGGSTDESAARAESDHDRAPSMPARPAVMK